MDEKHIQALPLQYVQEDELENSSYAPSEEPRQKLDVRFEPCSAKLTYISRTSSDSFPPLRFRRIYSQHGRQLPYLSKPAC